MRGRGRPVDASHDARWAELMRSAQDGDRAAYAHLLTEVLPWVRSITGHILAAPDDAEDAVQETLLTLHAIRHTYEPGRPFKPWLATIARRRALDLLRHRTRRRRSETPLEPAHEMAGEARTNPALVRLELAEVTKAMGTLPPTQQRALDLLKVEELDGALAAERSGMTVNALRVAAHRASKMLRKLFE